MAAKIFVRERRKVEKGEKKPRFRIAGVSGSDLKIYVTHVRKQELDQLAKGRRRRSRLPQAREKAKTKSGGLMGSCAPFASSFVDDGPYMLTIEGV